MAGSQVSDSPPTRMGNMGAMVRVMRTLDGSQPVETDGDPVVRKRKLVAGLCRLLGEQFAGPSAVTPAASVAPAQPQSPAGGLEAGLAPRMQQTLRRLLAGDAEKEIAKTSRRQPAHGTCVREGALPQVRREQPGRIARPIRGFRVQGAGGSIQPLEIAGRVRAIMVQSFRLRRQAASLHHNLRIAHVNGFSKYHSLATPSRDPGITCLGDVSAITLSPILCLTRWGKAEPACVRKIGKLQTFKCSCG